MGLRYAYHPISAVRGGSDSKPSFGSLSLLANASTVESLMGFSPGSRSIEGKRCLASTLLVDTAIFNSPIGMWGRRMSTLLDKMAPIVDHTIKQLNERVFRIDPIGGLYSRATSILSSAYKRHGFILEQAILNRLMECEYFDVWEDRQFVVQQGAEHLVDASDGNYSTILSTSLPYKDEGSRTLQIDAIVHDKRVNTIRCYEIKRGAGLHDSGKRRSILRDLLCAQVLLKDYAEQKKGHRASVVEAKIIFYYGQCSIKKPFSLTKEELDEHFVFPVANEVEKVNAYFQQRLFEIIEAT